MAGDDGGACRRVKRRCSKCSVSSHPTPQDTHPNSHPRPPSSRAALRVMLTQATDLTMRTLTGPETSSHAVLLHSHPGQSGQSPPPCSKALSPPPTPLRLGLNSAPGSPVYLPAPGVRAYSLGLRPRAVPTWSSGALPAAAASSECRKARPGA